MRSSTLIAPMIVAGLALAVSGCDDRTADEPGSGTVARYGQGPKPEGVSSPDDAVTTTFYVPNAAIGDLYEITAGKLALEKSDDPEVRQFAARMVADHQQMLDDLKQFIADNPINIAAPETLDSRRKAMIVNLKSASPDNFDHVYLGQQAAAHQKAYYLHRSYASNGQYPALAQLAQNHAKQVEQHRRALAALEQRLTSR